MKHSLLERTIEFVEEQIILAKTEEEKADYLQLLKELRKELNNPNPKRMDNLLISIIKNITTQGFFELLKSFL